LARNGSGIFVTTDGTRTGPNVHAQQKAASVKITASLLDATIEDIATALTASIAKDGQTVPTANLPMGGFKHTNVDDATALTDYARTDQVQNSAFLWGGTSGGSANAQTVTLSPAPSAYATGMVIRFFAGFSVTGAATLNVNGLGAKDLRKNNGLTALSNRDLDAGLLTTVVYDGVRFVVVDPFIPTLTTYTPTIGGTAWSSTQATYAEYFLQGQILNFSGQIDITTAGIGTITVSLPSGYSAQTGRTQLVYCGLNGTGDTGGSIASNGTSFTMQHLTGAGSGVIRNWNASIRVN
jgi:hypothetical protein